MAATYIQTTLATTGETVDQMTRDAAAVCRCVLQTLVASVRNTAGRGVPRDRPRDR